MITSSCLSAIACISAWVGGLETVRPSGARLRPQPGMGGRHGCVHAARCVARVSLNSQPSTNLLPCFPSPQFCTRLPASTSHETARARPTSTTARSPVGATLNVQRDWREPAATERRIHARRKGWLQSAPCWGSLGLLGCTSLRGWIDAWPRASECLEEESHVDFDHGNRHVTNGLQHYRGL